jgi:hypothetical protein
MPPAKKETKDNVGIVFDNIFFYAIIFLCILMISAFGLIAEA